MATFDSQAESMRRIDSIRESLRTSFSRLSPQDRHRLGLALLSGLILSGCTHLWPDTLLARASEAVFVLLGLAGAALAGLMVCLALAHRAGRLEHLDARTTARSQGWAFACWFAMLNLIAAAAMAAAVSALLKPYGTQPLLLGLNGGLFAAAAFAITGLLAPPRVAALALCWSYPLPIDNWAAWPRLTALSLDSRCADALHRDRTRPPNVRPRRIAIQTALSAEGADTPEPIAVSRHGLGELLGRLTGLASIATLGAIVACLVFWLFGPMFTTGLSKFSLMMGASEPRIPIPTADQLAQAATDLAVDDAPPSFDPAASAPGPSPNLPPSEDPSTDESGPGLAGVEAAASDPAIERDPGQNPGSRDDGLSSQSMDPEPLASQATNSTATTATATSPATESETSHGESSGLPKNGTERSGAENIDGATSPTDPASTDKKGPNATGTFNHREESRDPQSRDSESQTRHGATPNASDRTPNRDRTSNRDDPRDDDKTDGKTDGDPATQNDADNPADPNDSQQNRSDQNKPNSDANRTEASSNDPSSPSSENSEAESSEKNASGKPKPTSKTTATQPHRDTGSKNPPPDPVDPPESGASTTEAQGSGDEPSPGPPGPEKPDPGKPDSALKPGAPPPPSEKLPGKPSGPPGKPAPSSSAPPGNWAPVAPGADAELKLSNLANAVELPEPPEGPIYWIQLHGGEPTPAPSLETPSLPGERNAKTATVEDQASRTATERRSQPTDSKPDQTLPAWVVEWLKRLSEENP